MKKKNGGELSGRLNVIFIELRKMIPPQIRELLELQLKLVKDEVSKDNKPIELEKLNRELKARINKLTALEKWCIFLSYRSNSQLQNLIKLVTVEEESIKEIAQKMKTNGIEINIIANCTGLSKEEIEAI